MYWSCTAPLTATSACAVKNAMTPPMSKTVTEFFCSCGGILKPDVVLYGESLDETVIARALYYIKHADMLIVGGTSLTVYPAAGMIDNYQGEKLVLINKTPTLRDHLANYAFYGKIGEIFLK